MQKITDEQQLKINKLINLKYMRHRRIMVLAWFFVVLYSVLVFFLLVHFHQVEYSLNGTFAFFLFLSFGIVIFSSLFKNENSGVLNRRFDVSVIFFVGAVAALFVLIGSLAGIFSYDFVPIEDCFLIFVILVLGYFLLCFFGGKSVTKNMLFVLYFIFYSIFLFPVLLQAVTNLGFLGKICNILFGISPLLFLIFRSYLADFFGSGYLVRKIFLKKDFEIWSCPMCHEYILKKPFFYCPNCGSNRGLYERLCRNCGFPLKIGDFDIPTYCPHCGGSFRKKMRKRKM